MSTVCLALGYKDELDRVPAKMLLIHLSQHFQLVYINGSIHCGEPSKERTLMD